MGVYFLRLRLVLTFQLLTLPQQMDMEKSATQLLMEKTAALRGDKLQRWLDVLLHSPHLLPLLQVQHAHIHTQMKGKRLPLVARKFC